MEQSDHRSDSANAAGTPDSETARPLLAEDLLLLLFSPDNGTIGGEGTLFYALGGAVLTELALDGHVTVEKAGLRGTLVSAVSAAAPSDQHLRTAWDYASEKPREVQGVLALVGPGLRSPLLDRLVQRGDLSSEQSKTFGFIPKTTLAEGDNGRRAELMREVRTVLVDGTEPDTRTAALAGLLSASGALPTLYKEIPWTSEVATRASALQGGDWGASAAGSAVARTMAAITVNAAVAATLASNAANS